MDGAAAAEIIEDAAKNRPRNGDSVDQNHSGSSVEGSTHSKYTEAALNYIMYVIMEDNKVKLLVLLHT